MTLRLRRLAAARLVPLVVGCGSRHKPLPSDDGTTRPSKGEKRVLDKRYHLGDIAAQVGVAVGVEGEPPRHSRSSI